MIVGVVKEIKGHEYRVGMIPSGVESLVRGGHRVLIETTAGIGSGFSDDDYVKAGASIADSAERVFNEAEMIVKVKEPQPVECEMLRKNQVCFTYFHFAADRGLTDGVLRDRKSVV